MIQQIVHTAHDPGKTASESVVVTAMTDQDLDAFIADPYIMFCSDGGLRGSHPRGAGAFPRVLGVYVRERRVLQLEAAIHKMTDLAARRMGFRDRGRIRPGMKADLVLFDAATVKDTEVPLTKGETVMLAGQVDVQLTVIDAPVLAVTT